MEVTDPDYDEIDVLIDTDPIALGERCRKAERLLRDARTVLWTICLDATEYDQACPMVAAIDAAIGRTLSRTDDDAPSAPVGPYRQVTSEPQSPRAVTSTSSNPTPTTTHRQEATDV